MQSGEGEMFAVVVPARTCRSSVPWKKREMRHLVYSNLVRDFDKSVVVVADAALSCFWQSEQIR